MLAITSLHVHLSSSTSTLRTIPWFGSLRGWVCAVTTRGSHTATIQINTTLHRVETGTSTPGMLLNVQIKSCMKHHGWSESYAKSKRMVSSLTLWTNVNCINFVSFLHFLHCFLWRTDVGWCKILLRSGTPLILAWKADTGAKFNHDGASKGSSSDFTEMAINFHQHRSNDVDLAWQDIFWCWLDCFIFRVNPALISG